jgi:hypothetical protein
VAVHPGHPHRSAPAAWRITSQTELGALAATPALVGGDPVVTLEVARQTSTSHLYEFEVLRLAPTGGTRQRFAVAPDTRAVWGDTPITGVRVGPDGQLYRLRSDRATGVSIARYSLEPAKVAPPATTPAPVPTVTGPRVDQPVAAPTVTLPPGQPTSPAPGGPAASRWLMPGVAALAASLLGALTAWLLYRRSHPVDVDRPGRSGVAH